MYVLGSMTWVRLWVTIAFHLYIYIIKGAAAELLSTSLSCTLFFQRSPVHFDNHELTVARTKIKSSLTKIVIQAHSSNGTSGHAS